MPESTWLLERAQGWERVSSAELLACFERGEVTGESVIKVSEVTEPKPLRYFIKELIWSAKSERDKVHEDSLPHVALVNHAPIPTALSDLGGRIIHVNQQFVDFIGYTYDELIGMVVSEVSLPDDRASEISRGNEVLAGESRGFQMQKRYRTKSGEERIGLLSISMLHDHEGAPEMVLAQIADLTTLRDMQAQLHRSRMLGALGEMAQLVTHDLKNILMVLRGTLDLIQSQVQRLDAEDLELIEEGVEVCASGERLVRSLLDLNVVDAPELTEINLYELLSDKAQVLRRAVAPVPFAIELSSGDADVIVRGQELWIERILINLCVNARQAIESADQRGEGLIKVKLSLVDDELPDHQSELRSYALLEVEDSGEGIPPELQQALLEPYNSTRRDRGGHGLGLTAVITLCEHLNARFSLSSEVGVGSVFRVEIPVI